MKRLPHRCERWPHMSRERNVIETDNRNIFRDTYPVLFGNRQDTERHLIIPDENGAGPLIRTHREDGVCTNSPARNFKTALQYKLRVGNESLVEQGLTVSLLPFARAAKVGWALDMGNASIPPPAHVQHHLVRASLLVTNHP